MDAAHSLESAYRQYAPLVHARARRLVGDDADDVVHDVFVRLARRAPRSGALGSWIYVTSTNIMLDRLRFNRRRHDQWKEKVRAHAKSDQPLEEIVANRSLCAKLLQRADRKTQQIVVLKYFDEMPQTEIALCLGIDRKTVGQRLARFEEAARKMVKRWQS